MGDIDRGYDLLTRELDVFDSFIQSSNVLAKSLTLRCLAGSIKTLDDDEMSSHYCLLVSTCRFHLGGSVLIRPMSKIDILMIEKAKNTLQCQCDTCLSDR